MNEPPVRSGETDALRIASVEHDPTYGGPVILSHGFPYDVQAFDEVASILVRAGARAVAPYASGFGCREALYEWDFYSGAPMMPLMMGIWCRKSRNPLPQVEVRLPFDSRSTGWLTAQLRSGSNIHDERRCTPRCRRLRGPMIP
jgi:pimeloyl-ACP methyl ester carboxylesterase